MFMCKSIMILRSSYFILMSLSFKKRPLCHTLSNAFCTSRLHTYSLLLFCIFICTCIAVESNSGIYNRGCVRFQKLVTFMDSCSEAVHCLCTNLTLFQLVPLTNSSDKEGDFELVCLRVWYLKTSCMVYLISLDKISSLKVSLNTWFDVSFVSKRNKKLVSIDCWSRTLHNFV